MNGSRASPLRIADLALRVGALVLLASVASGALQDVSQAWDSGYYHLPFAARLGGILPGDVFVFHPANQARFDGFPLLGELLQGILWRVTGRAESTNLVAFASVPLLSWFLWRRFGVPPHVAVLALFAIPLVQTHATSSYIDLPANAALSVVVLLAIQSFAAPAPVAVSTLVGALVAAAIAANMKALAHPIVAVALVALGARAWRGGGAQARRRVAAMALALPLVFATPLKNAIAHRNPYFPIRAHVAGAVLPGTEDPYASSPAWLAGAPRPARFACSILEIGALPLTNARRWTVDQWTPAADDGYRMGGFFGAYVIVNLALLAWRALRERDGPARRAAAGFAVLTAITSVMPQSHELRYYLAWMIVLVAINAWLACRPGAPPLPLGPRGFGALAALALIVVAWVTDFAYVHRSGASFDELVAGKVDAGAVSRIPAGARVCVQREPWNLLYAAPFHAPKRYVVNEAEASADCAGAPAL